MLYEKNPSKYFEKWSGLKEPLSSQSLISLGIADMDYKAPQQVIDKLNEIVRFGIYSNVIRPESYYNSIISWIKKRYNWEIKKEWINTATRIIPSIGFAIRALTKKGDKIIIQTPVYDGFSKIILKSEREVVTNPLIFKNNKYYMDYADLEIKARDPRVKILILCNPHNPVGRVWTEEELRKMGELCLRHEIIVICDQAYSDLTYSIYKYTPFASISKDFAQNCVVCRSLSKPFNLAGLHTAYVIIPKKSLFNAYDRVLESLHLKRSSLLSVVATEVAYEEGEIWLNEIKEYTHENLQFMKDFIESEIPMVNVIEPEFAFLAWLDLRKLKITSHKGAFFKEKARVLINEGTMYGEGGEGFIRVNIACSRETLRAALERIKNAINTYHY